MRLQTQWILLAFFSLFALGVCDNIRGPLFPELLSSFGVSSTEGSWFFMLSSGMGLLGSWASQILIHRLGKLHSLRWSVLLMGLSCVGLGSAQAYWQLLLASAIFGFSIGLMGVVQNVMVLMASDKSRMQQTQSGLHAMYAISSLLAPLVVAMTFSISHSWRWAFYSVALLSGIFYLACFLTKSDLPEAKNSIAVHESQRRQKFLVAFMLGSYVVLELLVSTRLAQFVRTTQGMSLEESSYFTSLFFISLFLGRLGFALYRPAWTLLVQMQTSLLLSILCFALGIVVHPIWLALSGLVMAPFYPLTMTWAGQRFPKEVSSVTSYMVMGSGILLVSMHFFVGILTDASGIQSALWVGPFFGVLALAVLRFFIAQEKVVA